ncbi:MAG: Ig-like domain-containing protein [Lachnospiraceae bacterium]|nr:Ig-like domain-containing protein [Lachnospiraceae bacterium]
MVKIKWKKAMAAAVAAAMTMMAVPSMVFADEITEPEEIVVYESEDAEQADGIVFESEDETEVETEEADVFASDNWEDPTAYTLGQTVSGKAGVDVRAYYKISNLAKTGRYRVTASSRDGDFYVKIVDTAKAFTETSFKGLNWERPTYKNTDSGDYELKDETVDLLAGKDYWIVIYKGVTFKEEVDFDFKMELENEVTGCKKDDPWTLTFKSNKCSGRGTLFATFRNNGYGYRDIEEDPYEYGHHYYKFHLEEPGRLWIDSDSSEKGVTWVYSNDMNFDSLAKLYWKPAGSGEYTEKKKDYVDLIGGDYYLKVYNTEDDNVDYSFAMDFKPIKVAKGELPAFDTVVGGSNNTQDDAFDIEVDQLYVAQSTQDNCNKFDWFHFVLPKASPIYVELATTEVGYVGYSNLNKGKNYTDGVSVFGSPLPHVYAPDGVNDKNNEYFGESSTPFYSSDTDFRAKKASVFPAGEYWIQFSKGNGMPIDGEGHSIPGTGCYKLKISTGPKAPVTAVKIIDPATKKAISAYEMTKNSTKTLTYQISPDTTEQGASWSIDNTDTATIDSETGEIKAKSAGTATITVTTLAKKKDGKNATATCKLTVLDQEISDTTKDLPETANVVSNEKIGLINDNYFGKDFVTASTDKWVVKDAETDTINKKLGSVKKDKELGWVFAAGSKINGKAKIKVTRQTKVGKSYFDNGSVTFTVEAPKYFKDSKKKDIKTIDVLKAGVEVKPEEMIDFGEATVKPNHYECNDKKGLVEFDKDTGVLKVLKSGTFKVTAYYGYDASAGKNAAKNAGKIEYTVKAKLPTVKDAKVKPNAAGGKDKIVTVAVSNVPKGINLADTDWKAVTVDESGNPTTTPAAFVITPVKVKESYTKCTVAIPAATPAQKFAVVVTVDDVDYPAIVTVN